jgi:hypothetical protein
VLINGIREMVSYGAKVSTSGFVRHYIDTADCSHDDEQCVAVAATSSSTQGQDHD